MKKVLLFLALVLSLCMVASLFTGARANEGNKSDRDPPEETTERPVEETTECPVEETTRVESTTAPEEETEPAWITFYIDDHPYTCSEGTTWRQLIENPSYNVSGIRNADGYVGTGNAGRHLVHLQSTSLGLFLKIDDPVIDDGYYYEMNIAVYENGISIFHLAGESYAFAVGQTWAEFVSSEFNSDGIFVIDGDGPGASVYYVSGEDGQYVCLTDGTTQVVSNDMLMVDYTYTYMTYGD